MRKELTLKDLAKLYDRDLKYSAVDWTKSCIDTHTESVGAINAYVDFRKKMLATESIKQD